MDVINLEDVWKLLGYNRKEECKRVLNKHFTIDIDYKVFRRPAENSLGGRPTEQIMLNVDTF